MTFKQAIKSSLWDKYSTFEGRASRREYWYFVLCCVSVRICVEIFLGTWFSTSLVEKVLGGTHRFYLLGTLGTLINIALILPLLAVGVRRSQDFGLSGRLYLGVLLGSIAFAVIVLNSPILGAFTSLLFAVYVGLRKGDTYQNRYGDVPTTSHDPVPETSETGSRRLIGQLCLGIGLLAALDLTLGYMVNDTEASNAPSYAEMIGQKTVLFEPGSTRYSEGTDSLIWAFNFPIGMNVDPVLAVNDAIIGFDADRPVVTIRDGFRVFRPIMERRLQSIENSSTPVRLLFSLPDFGNVQGELDDQPTSSLHVTLQPEPRRYATQKDWGTSPSFMDEVEKLTQFECVIDGEIAPGIARYREPTLAESENILQRHKDRGPRFEYREGCIGRAATSGAAFTVLNDAGEPSGFGRCAKYRSSAAFGSCRFTFWLPQERFVEYRFSEQFLPDLRQIDAFVRTQLANATVLHASQNVPNL